MPDWAKLIDKTLATAMTLMISKAANAQQLVYHAQILERQVGRDRHRARTQGWSIRGQQHFWWFIRHYKTSDRLGRFYGIYDLAQIHWLGDNKIEQFRSTWDHYVGNLRTTANKAEEWEEVLLKQLEKSTALQADIAYYRRIHQNHKDKSY